MPITFDKGQIQKAMQFVGVVVRSSERTLEDGTELWGLWFYNRSTDKFVGAENVRNVDPTSNGYARSGLYKRLKAFESVGISPGSAEGYEGYEVECHTVVNETPVGTSVRTMPVRKIGKVGQEELAMLQARLEAQLQSRGSQGSMTASTSVPTATNLTDAEISQLVGIYDGRSEEEAQAAAGKVRGLDTNLYNAIATGTAAQTLMGQGHLTLDNEGKFAKNS